MKYTQDMMLQSDSGYCMPFEEKGKDVEMSLGYGKQKHPKTGEMFFHHQRTLSFWNAEEWRQTMKHGMIG